MIASHSKKRRNKIPGVTAKESNGYIYSTIANGNPVPAKILPYESVTISVRLKIHQSLYARELVSFGSGNLVVSLKCGSNAVWIPLAVPWESLSLFFCTSLFG